MQDFFVIEHEWATTYPGAKAGILVIEGIEHMKSSAALDERRINVEEELRTQFAGYSRDEINSIPIIDAYNRYYKNFGKTYHVRSQVESIVNGKSLVSASAVLTAMFMAEVQNMLLTAGHDLDVLELPVRITVGKGTETYVDIRGAEKTIELKDMVMADGKGVISSIILGPDGRTKITPATKNALFAVYAPREVEKELVLKHLQDIEASIKLFSPHAETRLLEVFEAIA